MLTQKEAYSFENWSLYQTVSEVSKNTIALIEIREFLENWVCDRLLQQNCYKSPSKTVISALARASELDPKSISTKSQTPFHNKISIVLLGS